MCIAAAVLLLREENEKAWENPKTIESLKAIDIIDHGNKHFINGDVMHLLERHRAEAGWVAPA